MKKIVKWYRIPLVNVKELFKISKIKRAIVHLRIGTKFVILTVIATFLIISATAFVYKPIYSVSLNGEEIGYSENKSELQEKINNYIENGNGDNIAFVEIDQLPDYQLCLLKKDKVANDEEIFDRVISNGIAYYKYYAITVDSEEKKYVSTFAEAEDVIDQLKDKNSNNIDKLAIVEKYSTELVEFKDVETCVADLYEKKIVRNTYVPTATMNTSGIKVDLGISLIKPVNGIVTSRFGARWGRNHKGTDIGADKGTTIVAAASGTVILSEYGYNGGFGNYVIISHGNGIQTLYAHCNSLIATEGEYVTQGQAIATVGNTGDSTGNHLHLEIRVNGVSQDPQNYLY